MDLWEGTRMLKHEPMAVSLQQQRIEKQIHFKPNTSITFPCASRGYLILSSHLTASQAAKELWQLCTKHRAYL